MENIVVNVKGQTCPIPLIEVRKALRRAAPGQIVEVFGTHQASKREIPMAVKNLGLELVEVSEDGNGVWRILIRR
jgi:tRNA 2-thiouridine synthesizing protein A